MLPNFICVGAQKAGSSSLYKLLKSHPELHVSEQKEIHYYNIEENYEKGLAYYERFFKEGYGNQKLIGEFTPDYLQYSFVPPRIKKDLGDVKILIILRHPVQRAYSQFNFHRMLGHESMSSNFEQVLEEEKPVLSIDEREEWYSPAYYRSKSMYFEQIKRYCETFGKGNVHLVIFEEMLKEKGKVDLKKTCQFLGVNDRHTFEVNHSNPTVLNFHSKRIEALRAVKDMLIQIIPEKYINSLKNRIINRTYKKPEKLDHKIVSKLYNQYFLEDVKKLEKYYGIDLSIWN